MEQHRTFLTRILPHVLLVLLVLSLSACTGREAGQTSSGSNYSGGNPACQPCGGSGRCRTCNGTGRFLGSGDSGCNTCSGSGVCINCGGRGRS